MAVLGDGGVGEIAIADDDGIAVAHFHQNLQKFGSEQVRNTLEHKIIPFNFLADFIIAD